MLRMQSNAVCQPFNFKAPLATPSKKKPWEAEILIIGSFILSRVEFSPR